MRSLNTFRERLGRLCRMALCLAAGGSAVFGIDPGRAVSQYVRDRWGPEHGFPRGPVYAIAQTPDGYLWIGTEAGLVRFDGLNFRLVKDRSARVTTVLGLIADNEGNLWVRMPGSMLLRYRNGVFEDAMTLLGMPFSHVTAMCRAKDGTLLISRLEDGAINYRNGNFHVIAAVTPSARSPIISFAQTSDGDMWMGTRDIGLLRVNGEQVSVIAKGLPDTKINTMLALRDRRLWIGTDQGIALWDGSKLVPPPMPPEQNRFQALAMTVDRDANVWVGTDSRGLLRVNARGVTSLDEDRIPAEAVTAVFEDREGSVWTGRANSLERLRDSAFVTYSQAEGLPTDGSTPLFVDEEDRVWFPPVEGGLWWMKEGVHRRVADAGLDRDIVYSLDGRKGELWLGRQRGGLTQLLFQNGAITAKTIRSQDGLAQDTVYSLLQTKDGTVWAGTPSGGVSRYRDGTFANFTTADGLASNTVASILETSDGTTWFATPAGLSALKDGKWRTYSTADGLPSANLNCLFEDSARMLWVGTSSGLAYRDEKGFHGYGGSSAALREQILGIAEDRFGSFWMSTPIGVLRVNRGKLLRGPLTDIDIREFGIADGLRGITGVKRHRSVVADSRGRIWFSMNRGISVVDPERLNNTPPAIVHIQSLLADGNPIELEGKPQLPGGSRRITFSFAGLSLSVPERVRFRYRLDGFDRGWSDASQAREAIYTNLGPSSYKFRVIASNPDGDWNSIEANIDFDIEPLFWQTWWFRLAAILGVAIAAAAAYRVRLHQLTGQLNVRFEERLAERTRIAQELHDTLLQGFLSASMQLHVTADRLPDDSAIKQPLDRVLQLMSKVIDEGRNAVRGLRSTAGAGDDLVQAFSRIQHELALEDAFEFRILVEGQPIALHPVLRDEIYRIGREALVNAFRHSKATQIEMEIHYSPRHFRVRVRDNGCGIEPSVLRSGREGHWGLPGMRERTERIGGQLHVWSSAAAGTEVELTVPGNVALHPQPLDRPFAWLFRKLRKGEK